MTVRLVNFALAALGVAALAACSGERELAPGQIWSYKSRPGEGASTVQILHVERATAFGDVAFISLRGLNASHDGGRIRTAELWPLAFPVKTLKTSLTTYQYDEPVKRDYKPALAAWQKAAAAERAGERTFNGSILEALKEIESDTPAVRQRRFASD